MDLLNLVKDPTSTLAEIQTTCDIADGSGLSITSLDPQYQTIMNSYNIDRFGGSNRSKAINIVNSFMRSKGIVGDAINLSDYQLHKVLSGLSTPAGELNGYSRLFDTKNSTDILKACNDVYLKTSCGNSTKRYAPRTSGFTNRSIVYKENKSRFNTY